MAGPVPAIHVFEVRQSKTWMPGPSPGMTKSEFSLRLRLCSAPLREELRAALRPGNETISRQDSHPCRITQTRLT
jgi:hypothetical protein